MPKRKTAYFPASASPRSIEERERAEDAVGYEPLRRVTLPKDEPLEMFLERLNPAQRAVYIKQLRDGGLIDKNLKPIPPPRGVPTPSVVYRFFDAEGKLLYIGVSMSFLHRLTTHASDKDWFEQVTHIEVEHFPSREDALEAEEAAIRSENPRYNVALKPKTLDN